MRIGVGNADTFAEGYYATDMGFFAKAGHSTSISRSSTPAVRSSSRPAATHSTSASPTPAIWPTAIAHGAPFTLIAGAGMYTAANPTDGA